MRHGAILSVAFAGTYETLWVDPCWLIEARAWIERQLSAHGREIAGPIDPSDDGLPLRLRRLLELCG